jgi:hypothetical protein
MGIAAVGVEANEMPNWASQLTSADATRAAQFATLELNGFPPWFTSLAESWPHEVAACLVTEVVAQISASQDGQSHGVLQNLAYGSAVVASAVSADLFGELQHRSKLPPSFLSAVLDVLLRGTTSDDGKARLAALALRRFEASRNEESAALYLSAGFATDPIGAAEALAHRLDSLREEAQTRLVLLLLPSLFGDFPISRHAELPHLPSHILERLVVIAFRTIRVEHDTIRPSGEAYADERDRAQHARNNALNQLASTPGRATFEALRRLAEIPDFPVSPDRLRELALERAAKDSEHAPWPPSEAYELEESFDVAPTTPADLQEVAVRRLHDIQHSLLNDDFAQGRTVKGLQDEMEVQKWFSAELRNRQGRAYSLEREPHVVEEKEPDIRLRAKSTDASLPIEVKVPESWSLSQLEDALNEQLGARYLRAKDANYGILLLVHQTARPRGWRQSDGSFLPFGELVAHLRRMAQNTSGSSYEAPQALVEGIDVSSLTN